MFGVFFNKHISKKYRCLKIAVFFFLEITAHQGMSYFYTEYKGFF